ncbi:DUF2905 domain-containing protein [Sporolactobacillus spathodeae]|uniref:Uncharacterized protein HemY n=1 Tax=Sporolactobacillus spathodeae TaxID=1465502 RepID=A0ABS2Q767_9BACL|nr:DUF2905 domain-containing protein [Sporolactobacillus spathodeae]MBM7657431.1 uncharacterized protein HemY [Sporolactobacillus spathodeae]
MGDLSRTLMVLGVVLFIVGLCLPLIGKIPGDIVIKKGNVTFMFPIVTCLVISLVLSLIFYLINHFR